ncbi:putative prepilin peptidase transmembrane protein [Candidatus Burkholderia humilis]|nr:putative prepilin peptidase transmembrane protein [Candidatus Burkholderia humilis]
MSLIESAIFIAWALAVVLFDSWRRLIPSSLALSGVFAALALAASRHSPFDLSFAQALLGLAVGGVALFPFYLLGMMGAADPKIFAALGAWCGPRALIGIWIAASLAAFVHALVLLARRRVVFALRDLPADASPAECRRATTPFGALHALKVRS